MRSAGRFVIDMLGLRGVSTSILEIFRRVDQIDQRIAKLEQLAPQAITLRMLGEGRLRARALTLGRMLSPQTAVGTSKVRLGCPNDGGYVMLNDFEGVSAALSFGIEGNVTWDEDAARRGLHVHQFDHTVDAPVEHPMFTFHRVKIVPEGVADGATVASIVSSLGITTPGALILKIDIEDSEWAVFDTTSPEVLKLFSQIVCEFHGFGLIADDERFSRAKRVIEKLTQHFAPIHVHSNNYSDMSMLAGVPFPNVLEVSFANRDRYRFAPSDELFPTPLDFPNDPTRPDYYLGRFQF